MSKRSPETQAPRVCVAYTLYRVRATAFLLPVEERCHLAAGFEEAVLEASPLLGILRSYSLVGLRADADFLLWQAAERAEDLQAFGAALRRTKLWGHLEVAHQYLAMTRRSQYVADHVHEGQDGRRTRVEPAGAPYLFVYPFIKTRGWYALPFEERQRMMSEHIKVGHKYPRIKINTTYSFGLDDQEFVVAFEGDDPSEFLDLVMELRGSEASQYTLRDTPAFTAVAKPVGTALAEALGIEEPEPAVVTQAAEAVGSAR
ncbi:MAG TPA: chlorite dismutase family protein [Chloroflexota bacterium]|nr:chlorite dismutase family protein [Chloroflexota bacterium]